MRKPARPKFKFKKLPDWVCLTIKDNGKSFDVKSVLRTQGNGRLGLLGMKERLQMVGGKFSIKSKPGHGTTVTARIPATTKSVEKHGTRSFGKDQARTEYSLSARA